MSARQRADLAVELQRLREEVDSLRRRARDDQLRIQALERELEREAAPVEPAADAIAGLDAFEAAFQIEQSRAKRGRAALTLALAEVDDLGGIADRCGHSAVEAACRHVAETLSSAMRPTDLVARLSDRELALLLPGTALDQALAAVTRLQRLLPERPFGDRAIALNFSAGIVQWRHDEVLADLLTRAARALHQARQGGGNRAVVG